MGGAGCNGRVLAILEILAITAMRNEGPNCVEWIAHHMAAGVTSFLIFSNDCDDETTAILDGLDAAGIITHVPFEPLGARSVQWQALKLAADHPMLARANWAMFIDCDEFINLRAPYADLTQVIAALPDGADAMALRWRLFGHSGHVEAPDALTLRAFTHAAPTEVNLPLAHFFKTLFRPSAFAKPGVHRPKARGDLRRVWVDGGGHPLGDGFAKAQARINLYGVPVRTDMVQLNHYSVRSAESFMLKRARGLPNHMDREIGLAYWVERNFNTVEDISIAAMIPATKAQFDALLQIGDLARLHAASRAIHRQKFNEMMQSRDNIQLFWQLALAADSTPPDPALARAQIARIRASQKDARDD